MTMRRAGHIATGHRRHEIDRVGCLEPAADDYVTKPFSLRDFGPGRARNFGSLDRVRRRVRAQSPPANNFSRQRCQQRLDVVVSGPV